MCNFKYILYLCAFLAYNTVKGQNIKKVNENGITKVIYKTQNRYEYETENSQNDSKFMSDLNENQTKIEFELLFDSNSSVFRVIPKMDIQNDIKYKVAIAISGGTKFFYKNNLRKEKICQMDFQGQKFDVLLSFNQYDWNIENEFKYINGFKCYKATSKINKVDKGRNTSKFLNPIVWFTSEIPSSFGPAGLDGLPGLVLEGTVDGTQYFFATKIISNYDTDYKIERPSKAIEVTEEEFSNINAEFYNSIKRN